MCNRIDHLMHLSCAGIRQAQYTDSWTCHLHRESRLTTHTDIAPPHPSRPWSRPPTHSPPTPPTPPQPTHTHFHSYHRIGKSQTQSSHPHTSLTTHAAPSQTRTHLTHTTNSTQLRTTKPPFPKSYLPKVHTKSYPSPLCPLCNIHIHNTHHLFNGTHIRTTLSHYRWTEKLAGGPQTGTSDSHTSSPTCKGHLSR